MLQQEGCHTIQYVETKTVLEIPVKLWCELLKAIKKEDITSMEESVEVINKHTDVKVHNQPSSQGNDELSVTKDNSGCDVVKRTLKCGDKYPALFTCSFTTGLPQPLLQAIKIGPDFISCIHHNRQPVACFCEKVKIPTRER